MYKDPRDFRPPEFPRDRAQFDRQQRPQNYSNQPRDAGVQRTDQIRRKVKDNMSFMKLRNC